MYGLHIHVLLEWKASQCLCKLLPIGCSLWLELCPCTCGLRCFMQLAVSGTTTLEDKKRMDVEFWFLFSIGSVINRLQDTGMLEHVDSLCMLFVKRKPDLSSHLKGSSMLVVCWDARPRSPTHCCVHMFSRECCIVHPGNTQCVSDGTRNSVNQCRRPRPRWSQLHSNEVEWL